MDSLGSPDISIFNYMNIFFRRNQALNMIVILFMAKKQTAEGNVTADEHCHSLSVLNQY